MVDELAHHKSIPSSSSFSRECSSAMRGSVEGRFGIMSGSSPECPLIIGIGVRIDRNAHWWTSRCLSPTILVHSTSARSARFFWEIPNGFSYVLEVPNRRVEEDLVLHEFLEGLSVNEPLDLATRIDDVEQVEPIPTQP